MPAAIATNGTIDLFASHRVPAWHGLGNVFDHEVTTSTEMLDLAGLSQWDIRESPMAVTTLTDTSMGMVETIDPARFISPVKAIVATIGGENVVLGVTGEKYTIVNNEDAFSFLQSLHDGARWETAGAIKGGRVVFGSMAFERDIVLDADGVGDVIKSYLLVRTSHDGSSAITAGITPTRVVCQNTLNVAMGNISSAIKIRHTSNAVERMDEAARVWRETHTYMDAFEVEAKALFAASATDKAYFNIVESLFPKPETDTKGSLAKWEKRQSLFAQAWNGAPNAGIKNTAWGVFNALTEANQWGRNIRSGEAGQESFFAAGAGLDLPTNAFRQSALNAARSLV